MIIIRKCQGLRKCMGESLCMFKAMSEKLRRKTYHQSLNKTRDSLFLRLILALERQKRIKVEIHIFAVVEEGKQKQKSCTHKTVQFSEGCAESFSKSLQQQHTARNAMIMFDTSNNLQ